MRGIPAPGTHSRLGLCLQAVQLAAEGKLALQGVSPRVTLPRAEPGQGHLTGRKLETWRGGGGSAEAEGVLQHAEIQRWAFVQAHPP